MGLAEEPALRAGVARRLNRNINHFERIAGGFNSQVYKVVADDGGRFAAKVYFRQANDPRDRLATEFESFSYLWANGFREIPQPVAANIEQGWAIYQFIEGERIPHGQVCRHELAVAADFLGRLCKLSRKAESRQLGTASEAFFAVDQIADNVRRRLQRLEEVPSQSAPQRALHEFLVTEFKPLLGTATGWSQTRLEAAGLSFARELAWTERTLSPSDFGFHNALRQPDGRIVFLDFEYFGWDDPAKLIVDCLLHPAMGLSVEAKRQFGAALFGQFSHWPNLRGRVEAVYPLFGLKWCLIILNEFLPDHLRRRQFAAATPADQAALQSRQLEKARAMFNQIRQDYECFPYHA